MSMTSLSMLLVSQQVRTGDLQGDGPAAQKYILAADPAIEQAAKDAETIVAEHALNFVEPCTRREVNIGHVTFADDVQCTRVACSTQQAAVRIADWDAKLDERRTPLNRAQNYSKRQVSARFAGHHAFAETPLLAEELAQHGVKGRVATHIKHLGTYSSASGSNTFEVIERIREAKVAWGCVGRLRCTRALSLRLGLFIWRGVIQSITLTAGLESCCLNAGDIQRLERTQVQYLRVPMLGRARELINNKGRCSVGIYSAAPMLRSRRVHWLQVVMSEPAHHVTLPAAIAGLPASSQSHTLTQAGVPTASASPWLVQFWHDVLEVMSLCPQVKHGLASRGWVALPHSQAFSESLIPRDFYAMVR